MKNVETRDVRRLIRYGEIDCVGLGKSGEHEEEKNTFTHTHAYGHMKTSLALMHALMRHFIVTRAVSL